MGFLTSIRSSLVVIIFTAITLILWLTVSFWYAAYVQRLDGAQLLENIKTEDLLFNSSRALSRERSLVNLMLSAKDSVGSDDLDKLDTLATSGSIQFSSIQQNINTAVNDPSMSRRFTFLNDEISRDYDSMEIKLNELNENRILVSDQATKLLIDRDPSFRSVTLNQYTHLIHALQQLRRGIHFIPRHSELNIGHLQVLRVANWKFSEAIAQEVSLVSGVLASTQKLSAKEFNKIESLHIETLSAWQTLELYMKKRGAIPELMTIIEEIEGRYFSQFAELRDVVLSDYQWSHQDPTKTLDQWLLLESRTTALLDELDGKTSKQIRVIASQVEAQGFRNLVIDSSIVLVCLLIGLAVISVLRKIRHLATHDALTGLPNRMQFEGMLQQDINGGKNIRKALMFVDLDGFKHVNDTLGHDVGDKLLCQVAQRMNLCVADRALVARYGGDEFSILFSTYSDTEELLRAANELIETVNDEFYIDGFHVCIGASIGVSVYPDDAHCADDLQKNADFAMYHAKSQGRNCVYRFDSEMAALHQRRLQLKDDLEKAIAEKQFELVYQPQVSTRADNVAGVEALIRWRHPENGYVFPDVFIALAEESGQIQEIGDWVLDEACRQMSIWRKDGLDNLQVAVNVCALQFMKADFVEYVMRTCETHDVDYSFLELEITESVLVNDVQQVIDTCHKLRNLGIRVAIDDFGTGYSSLSYLQDLPVDTLKIDRAFITGLSDSTSKSVARTIVMLAESCGLETVAEGVETFEQLEMVHELGCNYIQGYYYSKPVSPENIPQTIEAINQVCIDQGLGNNFRKAS